MRYTPEHKERTYQLILAEAANAIRAQGPDRVGVADVMSRLGLTHGGFYAHFKSKDDLIAQAITHMFDRGYAKFLRWTDGLAPREALRAYIDAYVSSSHRDAVDRGCPLPTLSGEVPRMTDPVRERFTTGAERLRGALAQLLRKHGTRGPDAVASSMVSEMVGALMLARATSDVARSDEILTSTRRMLKERLGLEAPKPAKRVRAARS